MRRTLALLLAGLCSAAAATAQTLPIFNSRITGLAEVKSGGELEIESGATLDVQSGATVTFGAPLSLANGGLGVALTDPGADRLLFWDDSGSALAWLTIGSGLSLSGTELTATGSFTSPMTTAGDLIVGGTDGAAERLAIGTDGQVLSVVSGAPAWATALTNPMTTAEDLIVGGTDGVPERLGVGSEGQVLKVVSGVLAWGTDSTGAGSLPGTPSEGDLTYFDGTDWAALGIGTAGQILTVNATADAPEWAAAPEGFANPMTTAEDLIVGGTDGAAQRLAVGAEGQVLTVVSGAVAWEDIGASGMINPMTTAEDLIVGGTDGLAERLAVGSEGQVLKVVSGAVAWGTDSTGAGSLPGTPSEGDLAYYDGADWVSLAVGTAGQVLTVNSTADAPEWAASTGGMGNPMTSAGDIIIGGTDGAPDRLAIGTEGQVLKVSSGSLAWGSSAGAGNVIGPGSGPVDQDFTWDSNGDANGLIYFIGSEYGTTSYTNAHTSGEVTVIRSTGSGMTGAVADLVDRAVNNTHSGNTAGSWAAIDFGSGRSAVVTDYTLRARSISNSAIRSWKLQGSNDVSANTELGIEGATWTDLDVRSDDTTMGTEASAWAKYTLSSTPSAYRWIRVIQTGLNTGGSNYLFVAEWEFYGLLNYISEGSTENALVVWSNTDGVTVRDSTSTLSNTDGISTPGLTVGSGTKVAKILSGTGTLNYSSIAADAEATATITVTGAVTTGTPMVSLGFSAALEDGIIVKQAWVSAANTVSVRVRNASSSAIDPAAVTVRATVVQF